MSFSGVSTIGSSTAHSFSITPHAVGNFFLLGVLSGFPTGATTSWATAMSGSNITWSVLVAKTTFATNPGVETYFIGQATGTSAATQTVTFNTGNPTTRTAWQEFSSTAGFSAVTLDVSGTVDTASSGHYPTLTPGHGAGELYWSYCWDTNSVANGSTSGYTYQADANGNGMCYNVNCANSAQTPNTGNTDGLTGIGVLLYEASSSTPVAQADAAGAIESITISLFAADTAGAADALTETAAAPQADVAAGADSIRIGITSADVAAGTDAMTETAAAPQPDAGGAVESMGILVTAPQADTAGADDSMAITVGPTTPDNAGAVDSVAVTVQAPSADVAAGAESVAVTVTGSSADTAGSTDKLTVTSAPATPDVAAATDSISIHAAESAADVAGAREAMSFPVPITAVAGDAAGSTDSMFIAKGGGGTFVNTLPGGGGSYVLPAGYQGGPSGAGSIAPDALGNSWEIEVRAGTDYSTLLAVIPGTMLLSWQFARMLDDIGSGTVILSQDDPWWSTVTLPGGLPAETLLDDECLWQVWKDGVCRFEFFGETVTEQLVDPSEQRQVTVTGPGTLTCLKWAMVAPQGFPNIVLKLDGLLDAFDEVDNTGQPVLDTNIWTTATPASDVYITPIPVIYNYPTGAGYALSTLYPSGSLTLAATAGTTFLGASPYDATDTLISAQITPIGVSSSSTDSTTPAAYGTGLNGSELTQFYVQSNKDSRNYAMIALSGTAFYAQLGSAGQVQTKILPAYDNQTYGSWMITEQAGSGGTPGTFYFWASSDGQNWQQLWSVVHSWDATNVTFFVTATYSATGQTVQVSNLNSNVTTPSYQGSIYLGLPMMGVWFDQFAQAQARGTIPFVTTTASPAGDSYGRAWTDVENVQAVNGTDLYSFLQGAVSVVDADYVMDPGFQLRIGIPATGQVALGVDRSGYIILRDGVDVMARQRVRARDQIATLIGGENSDGHEISADSPAFIAEWGQREAWFQTSAQVDPTSMAYATASSLAQNETEIVSWSFSLVPNLPGKTIFDNFDVGDWVGLERPDFSAVDKVRVVGIAVQVDSSGTETHELTFESYIQWLAEQLTYLAKKLGGAFVNTQGTTPVAPSKYGTGQVPTYFTPAATLQGLADVATGSVGSAQSNAPLVYNPATGQYQAAGSTDPVTGQTIPVTVQTPAGSATLSDTQVVVNTGNGSTVIGLQGDGGVTSVDSGGTAPAVPDIPVVAGIVQGLAISWDGLLLGALPLSNFAHVAIYVGTSSGFTPSSANQVGTLSAAGTLTTGNLTAGTTYFVKLAAVSTSGMTSAATTAVSAVASAVPTSLLTGQLPASLLGNSAGNALNPNPFFNGGDLSGWVVTNGSVVTGAPPAGAPGGAQFAADVTSTAANCLLTGSPDPFPTTPGQPYVMTAWVYNPGGSAINVAIGFNWTSGTTTVSVAPGSWVPLTTVQTCPGGVTSAYQVIGPTASGHSVWVLGAVAAGQVPGQLIAAASVAAQQIAANTITAAQIAANTITAAQIAANTITAAQIQASTITAAQIAAATITATQIAGGTITAAKLAAGIIVAGIINGTTVTGASVVADGTNGEFLIYSGTPTSGNLIGSWSAMAGTDGFGNGWDAGLWIYDSGGNSIGLVPGGSGAASQLALSTGSGTPTPPSGTAAIYGAGSGAVQAVDGTDLQTYSVSARRSIVPSVDQTVSSSSFGNLFSSTVAATGGSARFYRFRAVLFIAPSGSTGKCGVQFTGPSGASGHFSVIYTAGNVVSDTGSNNFGVSIQPSFNLASGTPITATIEGAFSIPAGSSGTMALQAATTGSAYVVRAYSFAEWGPV